MNTPSRMSLLRGISPQPLSDRSYRKKHGIFYTPQTIASVLTKWAVRSPHDKVLDPSFGGCAFLEAATMALADLGNPLGGVQVYGVDVDPDALGFAQEVIGKGVPNGNLLWKDFMAVRRGDLPLVDAVVGNPPFVRHHDLSLDAKERAMEAIAEADIGLSRRASYWAYFVVHSVSFLKRSGRLAMILPEAVLKAEYAQEVRRLLLNSFRTVTLLAVREKLFDAAERVVVVVADGKGEPHEASSVVHVDGANDVIAYLTDVKAPSHAPVASHATAVLASLIARTAGVALGNLATIRIGAVTGANKYFILDQETQRKWAIPDDYVQPILTHASDLGRGLSVAEGKPQALLSSAGRARLLVPPIQMLAVPEFLKRYLDYGERLGIHNRYKCAGRQTWYAVTDRRQPDAFLTYMSWAGPRIVLNHSGLDCTNAVHRLFWTDRGREMGPESVALGMLSSISQLGAELVGRSYGGGVLKVEPTAATRIILPYLPQPVSSLFMQVDRVLERGRFDSATRLVDQAVVRGGIVTHDEMESIQQELAIVKARRMTK